MLLFSLFISRLSTPWPVAITTELCLLLHGSIHEVLSDDVELSHRVNIFIFEMFRSYIIIIFSYSTG
jgi:hypothetical protein